MLAMPVTLFVIVMPAMIVPAQPPLAAVVVDDAPSATSLALTATEPEPMATALAPVDVAVGVGRLHDDHLAVTRGR